MTDKHQALRDAIRETPPRGASPESVASLLADHDRMREALEVLLNALPSATWHPAVKSARKALKECEQ